MCGGPSQTQLDLQGEEAQFYKAQTDAYSKAYENFSQIQDTLNKQFAPVLAAGPGQKGFTTAEDNDLKTQIHEGTGVNFNKAQEAANAMINARGGGNDTTNITSGGAKQLAGELAGTAAATESAQDLGEDEANYSVGRHQYEGAIRGEEDLAAGWNPNSFANSADSSAKVANDEANTITQQQESVWGNVLGALGGVAGQWAGSGFGH